MKKALVFLAAVLAVSRAEAQPAVVNYYHLDAIGNVRAISDEAGQVIERHDYLPYGEEWNPQPSTQTRKFTGKERDSETGLDYFGARYYSGPVARFTSVDPVYTWSENLADPERWNRYAYVRNNPLRFADPDGREIIEIPVGNGQYLNLINGQVHPATPLTTTELKTIGVVLNTTNFGDWVEYAYEGSPDRSPLLLRAKDSLSADEIATAQDVVGLAILVGGVRGGGRYSGRYADGARAYRTNVPRDAFGKPSPDPRASGPHSRLQFDAKDPARIYSATEFDAAGNPVTRIDFAGRRGETVPHQHRWDSARGTFRPKEPLR